MGMKSPAKKKEIVKRSRPTDAELGKIDSNNGDAGKIISDLTAGLGQSQSDEQLIGGVVEGDARCFRAGIGKGLSGLQTGQGMGRRYLEFGQATHSTTSASWLLATVEKSCSS